MLQSSEYVDLGAIDAAVAVPYVELAETVNGVDQRYAETNGLRLVKRDKRYASDRALWEEVARNPDVAVVEENWLKWSWDEGQKGMASRTKPLAVGDDYPLTVDGRWSPARKSSASPEAKGKVTGIPQPAGYGSKPVKLAS